VAGYRGIAIDGEISDAQMEEIGVLESFKLLRISRKYLKLSATAVNKILEAFHEELQSIAEAEAILNPESQTLYAKKVEECSDRKPDVEWEEAEAKSCHAE